LHLPWLRAIAELAAVGMLRTSKIDKLRQARRLPVHRDACRDDLGTVIERTAHALTRRCGRDKTLAAADV
jgi:hypothetical protein